MSEKLRSRIQRLRFKKWIKNLRKDPLKKHDAPPKLVSDLLRDLAVPEQQKRKMVLIPNGASSWDESDRWNWQVDSHPCGTPNVPSSRRTLLDIPSFWQMEEDNVYPRNWRAPIVDRVVESTSISPSSSWASLDDYSLEEEQECGVETSKIDLLDSGVVFVQPYSSTEDLKTLHTTSRRMDYYSSESSGISMGNIGGSYSTPNYYQGNCKTLVGEPSRRLFGDDISLQSLSSCDLPMPNVRGSASVIIEEGHSVLPNFMLPIISEDSNKAKSAVRPKICWSDEMPEEDMLSNTDLSTASEGDREENGEVTPKEDKKPKKGCTWFFRVFIPTKKGRKYLLKLGAPPDDA